MFDNLNEEQDKIKAKKINESVMPETTSTTQMFTKKFTRTEWEKLDVVIDGLGYGKTIQDVLLAKYNIEFVDETCAAKNPITEYQFQELQKTLRAVLKANKDNYKNTMKVYKKFLMYANAEGNMTIIKWLRTINFIEIDVTARKGKENASAI